MTGELVGVVLIGERSMPIKELAGIKPFHRVPKTADQQGRDFVASVAAENVGTALDETYKALRDGLGYKRRELAKEFANGNIGAIVTPDFEFGVSIEQDADQPTRAVERREITKIRRVEALYDERFRTAFGASFGSVEFLPPRPLDIAAIIDRIEDGDVANAKIVDYDEASTYCELKIANVDGVVTLYPHTVRFTSTAGASPAELLADFAALIEPVRAASGDAAFALPAPNDRRD